MRPVRVVHCADVHLDSSFAGTGLVGERAKHRAEELKETFARVVRLVNEEQADLLLIAGDLLEHQYVRKATVQSVIDLIQSEIPSVPVFIAPGNHDPLLHDAYYRTMPWPDNVTIFGPGWTAVPLPALNTVVHGWGFDRAHVAERRLAELRIAPSDHLQIVVVHGSAEQFPSDEGTYLPLNRAECLECGADYIALGHFHSYGVVAERGGTPLAVYPGTPESLSFSQDRPHGAVVGTISKSGNDLRLVPVTRRRHVTLQLDCTGAQTLEEITARIEAAVQPSDRHHHLYRMALSGEVDPDLDVDVEVLSAKLDGRFYHLALRDQTTPALDLAALSSEPSLRGEFTRRLLARIEADAPRETELRLALRAGLAALDGGR